MKFYLICAYLAYAGSWLAAAVATAFGLALMLCSNPDYVVAGFVLVVIGCMWLWVAMSFRDALAEIRNVRRR